MSSLRNGAGRRTPPRLLASALDRVAGMDAKGLVAALRQSEERYRLLVERLPGIVYIDEPGAQGRYISPQIESMLGYSAEEWLEDPDRWAEALHPEDRDRAIAELTAGEQSGQRFTSEYRLLARDGRVIWFRDEATPTRDVDGRLLVHGVMFDVTRERMIEAELEAEVAERADVATALSSFRGGADSVATSRGLTREMLRLRQVDIAVLYAFHGESVLPLAIHAPPGAPIAVGRALPTARAAYLRASAARGPWIDEWRPGVEVDDYQRAWLEVGLRVGVYVPLSVNGVQYGLIAAGTTTEMSGPEMGRRLPALLEFAAVANAVLGPQLMRQSGELQINALRELIGSGGLRTVFQPVVRLEDRAGHRLRGTDPIHRWQLTGPAFRRGGGRRAGRRPRACGGGLGHGSGHSAAGWSLAEHQPVAGGAPRAAAADVAGRRTRAGRWWWRSPSAWPSRTTAPPDACCGATSRMHESRSTTLERASPRCGISRSCGRRS